MPRVRKIGKIRVSQSYDDAIFLWFCEEISDDDDRLDPLATLDRRYPVSDDAFAKLQTDWAGYREMVLTRYIARHPGQRPQAWWLCDSPERARRRVDGGLDDVALPGTVLHHGLPCHFPYGAAKRGEARIAFESEAAFLERHKLLTTSEQKRLKPADFAPDVITQQ